MKHRRRVAHSRARCVSWCPRLMSVASLAHAATPAATVPDTIEQRVAACIACHGREGATTNAGYFPRLAGKPAGYLFNQLVSFRDGRRFNSDMAYMVQHLSDAYLREMAEYFAGLDLPYPPISPPATPRPSSCSAAASWRSKAMRRAAFPPACNATARRSPACSRPSRGCWAAAAVCVFAARSLAHQRAPCAGARLHGRGRPPHDHGRHQCGRELAGRAADAGRHQAGGNVARTAAWIAACGLRRHAEVSKKRDETATPRLDPP
jgi:cytochrome c553